MTRDWSDLIVYVGAVVGLLVIIAWIVRICFGLMMYLIDTVSRD